MAFGRLLTVNNTLISVSCGYNVLGVRDQLGFASIGRALTTNSTLQSLSMQCTWMSDEGLMTLASGLAQNTTLTSLSISDNRFTLSGLTALVDGLLANSRQNGSLRDLKLSVFGGFCGPESIESTDKADWNRQAAINSANFFNMMATKILDSCYGNSIPLRVFCVTDFLLSSASAASLASLLNALPKLIAFRLESGAYLQHTIHEVVPELASALASHANCQLTMVRNQFVDESMFDWIKQCKA